MPELKGCERKMLWNGNELVFEDEPNVGVAGIAPGMPDGLGEQIADAWNHRPQWGEPVLEDGHLFAGLDTDQQAKLFVVVGDEPKPITHSQWCKVLNALGIESGGMPIAILHKWLPMPPKPED